MKKKTLAFFIIFSFVNTSCRSNIYQPIDDVYHKKTMEEEINDLVREERYEEAIDLAKKISQEKYVYVIKQIIRLAVLIRLKKQGVSEDDLMNLFSKKENLKNAQIIAKIGKAITKREAKFMLKNLPKLRKNETNNGKYVTKIAATLIIAHIIAKGSDEDGIFDQNLAEKNINEEDKEALLTCLKMLASVTDEESKEKIDKIKALTDILENPENKDKKEEIMSALENFTKNQSKDLP